MPNRILREGILDSDRLASVSLGAEVQFYRLLVAADDFGRYDGRVSVIRSRCWPLRDEVTVAQVEAWIEELALAHLIVLYEVGGKPFIELPNFNQRSRLKRSKYPSRDEGLVLNPEANPGRQAGGRTHVRTESESESESESVRGCQTDDRQATVKEQFSLPEWIVAEDWKDWLEVRKRLKAPNTVRAMKLAVKELSDLRAAGQNPSLVLQQSITRGWRGLFPVKDGGVFANTDSDVLMRLRSRHGATVKATESGGFFQPDTGKRWDSEGNPAVAL